MNTDYYSIHATPISKLVIRPKTKGKLNIHDNPDYSNNLINENICYTMKPGRVSYLYSQEQVGTLKAFFKKVLDDDECCDITEDLDRHGRTNFFAVRSARMFEEHEIKKVNKELRKRGVLLAVDERIRRNLALAKKASEFSDFPQHQLGCVLIYKKSVLSVGWNSKKSHSLQKQFNQYRNLNGNSVLHKIHAEIMCISKIWYSSIQWDKATLYIYREHKDGGAALAKPCLGCMRLIKNKGIKKIIYSDSNLIGYTTEIIC